MNLKPKYLNTNQTVYIKSDIEYLLKRYDIRNTNNIIFIINFTYNFSCASACIKSSKVISLGSLTIKDILSSGFGTSVPVIHK